jgi:hypothetical protein
MKKSLLIIILLFISSNLFAVESIDYAKIYRVIAER